MPAPNQPWIQAWLDAQRELARLAGSDSAADAAASAAQQRLAAFAADYAGLAAAAFAARQPGGLSLEAFSAPLVERYQRLFMPPGLLPVHPEAGQASAAWSRMQQASQRYAQIALAIATDAGRRLVAALSVSSASAAPITTLRELHLLWVDCGEAAWAAAVHGEDFAEAQAELLAALVELRAGASSR